MTSDAPAEISGADLFVCASFHDGQDCFVDMDNQIRSGNDPLRTPIPQDAFRNDRLRLRDHYLQDGVNRFEPAGLRSKKSIVAKFRAPGLPPVLTGRLRTMTSHGFCRRRRSAAAFTSACEFPDFESSWMIR
ncbi:MAG: hypothetical protein AUG08_07050 [Acidobacteria bacterium 13_1_20CM_2_55_15]|nr:MAG: hypothetical protein AUG08_07050 [Acidobacteria bacterium 13_1_20CM_2_55_15]